jgi:aarF domain-containing kinase
MKSAIKLAFGTIALSSTCVYYTFPDLRSDWLQLEEASKRLGLITRTAASMAWDYKDGISHEKHVRNAKKLRETLRRNGGCYVKLGQAISQLDMLVPEEYSDSMKPLMNEAATSSFETVKMTIEEDLGQPLESVFKEFDPKPLASASLAQVHRAVLHSGEEVAVKVQHKWIREQYPGDIRVIDFLAKTGNVLFSEFDYNWIVEDMRKSAKMELDFTQEVKHALKCAQIFKDSENVIVPKIYTEFCTSRVITMSFEKGALITDSEKVAEMGIDPKDLAETLSRAFNEMIFVHGFVHCDPHPGNILVRPYIKEGVIKPQIIILDHGLYRHLPEKIRVSYSGIWRSILLQDEEGMKKYAGDLGVEEMYPLLAGMIVGRPWEDIMNKEGGYDRLKNARGSEMDKEMLRNHALRWQKEINKILAVLPNDVVLLFKTFEWLRSIDANLGTPVNSIEIIADYCTRENTTAASRWYVLWKVRAGKAIFGIYEMIIKVLQYISDMISQIFYSKGV